MKIEAQFCHNTFHLVLKLFIFVCTIQKAASEDGMDEDFVPRNSVFFLFLQAFCKKIHSIFR